MAEYGEWNRKGATLIDVTAQKEYGIDRNFIVEGIRMGKKGNFHVFMRFTKKSVSLINEVVKRKITSLSGPHTLNSIATRH